jgi:creatinine amidohydrolase
VTASLYELTSAEVAAQLAERPTAVLAFGSVEQHGPHLPCGTDTMAAELVGRALAERIGALYVPFGPYGVTPLHAGHPGTISLRRSTFEALTRDVCSELVGMGVETLVLVNWHEVNVASLDAVATELQEETGARFYGVQACYVAQRLYAERGGSLTHGGSIETLAVMAYDRDLVHLDRAGEGSRPSGAAEVDEMRRGREVYGFVTDVTEIAERGWYGEPAWATPERAAGFPGLMVDEIASRLSAIGALRGGDR